MKARCARGFACLVLNAMCLACDGGGEDPADCALTLEEWCGDDACQGLESFDDALATAIEVDTGELSSVSACEDRAIVVFSDGFVGSMYLYDLESGDLLGGRRFTDIVSNDTCEMQRQAAGEEVDCDGRCDLLGTAIESTLEVEACEGALAEPLRGACLEEAPAFVEGCEACACAHCYPALLKADDEAESLNARVAVQCMIDRCPDECQAQIEALE